VHKNTFPGSNNPQHLLLSINGELFLLSEEFFTTEDFQFSIIHSPIQPITFNKELTLFF